MKEENYKNIELQEAFKRRILDIVEKPNQNIESLNCLLESYYQFCEKNHLSAFNPQLNYCLSKIFIVDSEPLIFDVDIEKVINALKHLQNVIEKNK